MRAFWTFSCFWLLVGQLSPWTEFSFHLSDNTFDAIQLHAFILATLLQVLAYDYLWVIFHWCPSHKVVHLISSLQHCRYLWLELVLMAVELFCSVDSDGLLFCLVLFRYGCFEVDFLQVGRQLLFEVAPAAQQSFVQLWNGASLVLQDLHFFDQSIRKIYLIMIADRQFYSFGSKLEPIYKIAF